MKSKSGKILLSFLVCLVFGAAAQAATFTVSNTSNSGAGSLRQAVSDSNSTAGSDTIVFDSLFSTAQTITLASVITINPAAGDSLTITGPGANLLTVSGNSAVAIFSVSSGDTASISGMTLTLAGAGAISNSGNLTVTNMTFSSNTDGNGGAISNGGASLTVTSCTFTDNTATSGSATGLGGGAIYNSAAGSIVNITGSTFTGNDEIGGSGGGGAIRNRTGTMTITNSNFTNNTAVSSGGGIQNSDTMTITGSTFTSNTTTSNGGGISNNSGGQLTVTNIVVSGNSSANKGGGIYYQPNAAGALLDMTSSTVSGNTANSDNNTTGEGGGLYLTGTGTVDISNSTVSGNQANGNAASAGNGGGIDTSVVFNLTNSTVSGNTAGRNGGGIMATGVSTTIVTIESSTIAGNTATADGGGVVRGSTTNPVNFHNTIVGNNTDDGTAPDIFGTVVSQGYNLIETTTGATINGDLTGNITGVDPMLYPLAIYGGTRQVHALMNGSPAVDAADPTNFPATDGRGIARPIDGNNAGGAQPDIGAYEKPTFSAASVTVSGRVSNEFGAISKATVVLTDSQGNARSALTSPFGYYSFENIEVGRAYIVSVSSKKYQFSPQIITVNEDVSDLNFSPAQK